MLTRDVACKKLEYTLLAMIVASEEGERKELVKGAPHRRWLSQSWPYQEVCFLCQSLLFCTLVTAKTRVWKGTSEEVVEHSAVSFISRTEQAPDRSTASDSYHHYFKGKGEKQEKVGLENSQKPQKARPSVCPREFQETDFNLLVQFLCQQ